MERNNILILDNDANRLRAFEAAVGQLSPRLRVFAWRDPHRMIAECHEALADAALIALGHHSNTDDVDPLHSGDCLEFTEFLAKLPPICPVIVHGSNAEQSTFIANTLRSAGWTVEHVMSSRADWIQNRWLPVCGALLSQLSAQPDKWYGPIKWSDQRDRLDRALLALHGLAIGDGIGEIMFGWHAHARNIILRDRLPPGPWRHTDDTEMAIAIVEVLRLLGCIDQDTLARQFQWRYERDPDRGYGSGTHRQLRRMIHGAPWRVTAREAFGGQGSMGNGSAMRVAPVGAWFADDLDRAACEARASAMITHMHPEGVAGAMATAVAAAMAWRLRGKAPQDAAAEFFHEILHHTPESKTRRGIARAFDVRQLDSPLTAARELGNGSRVTCPDTVPFAIWAAAKYFGQYCEAIAATASVGGDCDTNCAIVGGIVALSTGWEGLPPEWLGRMEALPYPIPTFDHPNSPCRES